MTPTDFVILRHLEDGHTCYGRHLARALWPDSLAWDRPVGRKHAAIAGKSMPGNAGRLANRLRERGLVERTESHTKSSRYGITSAGRRALQETP